MTAAIAAGTEFISNFGNSKLVRYNIRVFTTSVNIPSVTNIAGKLKITTTGRTIALIMPNIKEATTNTHSCDW